MGDFGDERAWGFSKSNIGQGHLLSQQVSSDFLSGKPKASSTQVWFLCALQEVDSRRTSVSGCSASAVQT